MHTARRFVPLDTENESRWVRLYVLPVGGQWVAVLVAEGVAPPRPDNLKGMGFFGDTPAEAEALALGYVGRCTEQNCEGGSMHAVVADSSFACWPANEVAQSFKAR